MFIQETQDEPFVDGFDIKLVLGEPVSKMGQSGKVISKYPPALPGDIYFRSTRLLRGRSGFR